jgi:hypothetical protein
MDKNIIKFELALYGIKLNDNGICDVITDKNKYRLPVKQVYNKLLASFVDNKEFILSLWLELAKSISNYQKSSSSGSEITQKIFLDAIIWFKNRCIKSKKLSQYSSLFENISNQDINLFSEQFMSDIINFRLAIDWIERLIRKDRYRILLLSTYYQNTKEAQSGPWTGGVYLDMKERVIDGTGREDDEDKINDGRKLRAPFDKENQIGPEYNDPYEFEEGHYFRERNNEPYSFYDQDENPYPHRNILWQ